MAASAHISALPTTLLDRIFAALPHDASGRPSPPQVGLDVLLVCKHWRDVGSHSLALWATVIFSDGHRPGIDAGAVQRGLERRRGLVQSVCIEAVRPRLAAAAPLLLHALAGGVLKTLLLSAVAPAHPGERWAAEVLRAAAALTTLQQLSLVGCIRQQQETQVVCLAECCMHFGAAVAELGHLTRLQSLILSAALPAELPAALFSSLTALSELAISHAGCGNLLPRLPAFALRALWQLGDLALGRLSLQAGGGDAAAAAGDWLPRGLQKLGLKDVRDEAGLVAAALPCLTQLSALTVHDGEQGTVVARPLLAALAARVPGATCMRRLVLLARLDLGVPLVQLPELPAGAQMDLEHLGLEAFCLHPWPTPWLGGGRLRRLALYACAVDERAFPSLEQCANLQELVLMHMTDASGLQCWREVPCAVAALTSLTALHLLGNAIMELPEGPYLAHLRILDLEVRCASASLPDAAPCPLPLLRAAGAGRVQQVLP